MKLVPGSQLVADEHHADGFVTNSVPGGWAGATMPKGSPNGL